MSSSYRVRRFNKDIQTDKGWSKKMFIEQPEYLSGFFMHRYEDHLYLQYRCPLCGDDVSVKLAIKANVPINVETEVSGEAINRLRIELSKHYQRDCGSNRERREKTAEILIDKFKDRMYG